MGGDESITAGMKYQRFATARAEILYLAEDDHVVAGIDMLHGAAFESGDDAVEQWSAVLAETVFDASELVG